MEGIMEAAAARREDLVPREVDGGNGTVEVSAQLGTLLELAARQAQQAQGGNGGGGFAAGLPPFPPAMGGGGGGGGEGDVWETPPPEAMEPSTDSSAVPTAKSCLAKIPRILIDSRSSVLHEATVKIEDRDRVPFDGVVGEFGREPPYSLTGILVAADPLSGSSSTSTGSPTSPGSLTNASALEGKIAVMKRGEGVTFAEKALQAQRAGAVGVVMVQNVPVWP